MRQRKSRPISSGVTMLLLVGLSGFRQFIFPLVQAKIKKKNIAFLAPKGMSPTDVGFAINMLAENPIFNARSLVLNMSAF